MGNPLMKSVGNAVMGSMMTANGGMGGMNIMQLMSEYRKFRNSFQGDARQTINELVSSGKVSNEQVQRVTGMAEFLQRYL